VAQTKKASDWTVQYPGWCDTPNRGALLYGDGGMFPLSHIDLLVVDGEHVTIHSDNLQITVKGQVQTCSNGYVDVAIAMRDDAPICAGLWISLYGVLVQYVANCVVKEERRNLHDCSDLELRLASRLAIRRLTERSN
jgi:hypothetical protein